MNFELKNLPKRSKKNRNVGLTMVMDKGLSYREAEDLMESGSDFIDIIKLGFGTGIISKKIKEKIQLYKKNNIKVHLGAHFLKLLLLEICLMNTLIS